MARSIKNQNTEKNTGKLLPRLLSETVDNQPVPVELVKNGRVLSTLGSLSGKLVLNAALLVVLCMLLFSGLSWWLVRAFYEHAAAGDASRHLVAARQAYTARSENLFRDLATEASSARTGAALTGLPGARASLSSAFARACAQEQLSWLALLDREQHIITQVGESRPDNLRALISAGQQNQEASSLTTWDGLWLLALVVPVRDDNGQVTGLLLASQLVNDAFAAQLAQNDGLEILLCQHGQLLGSNTGLARAQPANAAASLNLCAPGQRTLNASGQSYLTLYGTSRSAHQLAGTPDLALVDIEPLYNLNAHSTRAWQILVGTGIFVCALGISLYTLLTRTFFVRPLRQLQQYVQAMLPENLVTGAPPADELRHLTSSLNLLSASLTTRENENQEITKQMSDLLVMGDVLLSTFNLEHLLGEIVARLGPLMNARSVVLHLYGREMDSPWAVARWGEQTRQPLAGKEDPLRATGQSIPLVYIDPQGDITLAVTTKLAAVTVPARRPPGQTPSGKRRALRAPRLTPPAPVYTPRRPRIPQAALRELDRTLARIAMQKRKIVYAEDIASIYQNRGEAWALAALETGYRSVIAVPMLLQEQVIGAFILYHDEARLIAQSDTFLLTTAAIQLAMAIQNALLFAEVKEKNAALERVNHLKSQFLATVTHELRTPLHSIISYGALILEGFLDGTLTTEQEEHIQFMVDRAEDLSRLVDDMLDLSKIEADRLEVKPEPLQLAKSLREVVNQLKPMAQARDLDLRLEIPEEMPLTLADAQRVRQVVLNLVSNALKFTEKGGVTLRCTLLERYEMLRVSVHDTGIGISPAALDYIFEAFRQADGSTTRRFGGTGLGLTIARKLIELQGGEVAVESIPGQGSTFSFTLPLAPPAIQRTTQATAT